MKKKTRIAYGVTKDAKLLVLGDTVEAALKVNMMVKDYEKELIKLNPQLDIFFKIEAI